MQIPYSARAVRTIALLFFLGVVAFVGWLVLYAETKGPAVTPGSVIVMIPHRSSAGQIGHILAEAGLVYDDIRFPLLAKLTGYSKKFRAGEFRFSTGRKTIDVMRQLSEAKPVEHPVTIPEGLTAEEIAEIYAKGGWCEYAAFLRLVHDAEFIKSLGIKGASSLEGYLFPDTYNFTRIPQTDARGIIRIMVLHFQKVWKGLSRERTGKLTERETVILASIVEKETADPVERPMIAAVFLNRLRLGMRLQSDPTVLYGREGFSGDLTKEDLLRNTPYNTYQIPALPPGPICNPGKESLAAVLHPAHEAYLYFVSKNDGTHQFSKTLAEHNQAVWKYQKGKNIGEIKK